MPLILVPTPLGNLGDITLRSLAALRECDLLVAEDTRVARKLLNALALPAKPVVAYHEHNARSTPVILERARTERVVVTTDAGMPGISDPGAELVAAARAAGIPVEVLPGPSAAVGAAVLSGFELRRFTFEGFPARTQRARREQFERALASQTATIWYESPQRIRATLADLAEVAPDARVFLVREYTKLHEQQLTGTPAEVAAALSDPVRGEVTFVIARLETQETPVSPEAIDAEIDVLLSNRTPINEIAKALARRGLGNRRDLYSRATQRKQHANKDDSPGTP